MGVLILRSGGGGGGSSEFNGLTPDYYISTTGSDSNSGTRLSPWAITALNSKRATYAGKVVGLLDGTYDVSAANTPTRAFAVPLYNIEGGTSGSPTKIVSQTARGAWIQAKTSGGTYTGTKSTPPA